MSWNLLKTEEGTIDYTLVYTVYAENHVGGGVFTKVPNTETEYIVPSITPGEGNVLSVDSTGKRAEGIEVSGLNNNTIYRIVVEARDASGNTSRSRLLAYTASPWVDPDVSVSGVEASTPVGDDRITVIWDPKEGAQSYLIQAIKEEFQFGESGLTNKMLAVVCLPGSLLCENENQFSEELADRRLQYIFQVDKKEGGYKLVVVPFNFQDLEGLYAVDEEGRKKTFTEGVLALVEDETTVLARRLKYALKNTAQGVEIQPGEAGAVVDLVLESTGSIISASWGHGDGAEYYYAILTSEGVDAVTNTIDRYDASGRFTGGGYTSFSGLTANTLYTVTVQSFMVNDNVTNMGGKVSVTLSTKDAQVTLDAPEKVVREDLTLINEEAGKFRITWSTPESNSVIGYNIFYWAGDTVPDRPQYVTGKGKTNIVFTVDPGNYNARVDVLSTYPRQEVVIGDISSIMIYGNPLPPTGLGVVFPRGRFINIANKLYVIGYPLTYTEVDTPAKAGGSLSNVSYLYRYQVEGGDWVGYKEIVDESMISLRVDDLNDAAVVKSGYGKKYQVEAIVSNAGGFVSDAGTLEFTYKSFPEPFLQSDHLEVEEGDHSLTVSWPAVSEVNGSTVSSYTVVLNKDPYELPIQSTNIVERRVIFENLENNQPYSIMVIPNSVETGSVLDALSVVTGYTIGDPIEEGSKEASILAAYTGAPEFYTPQGSPEAVVNLAVTTGENLATVTWRGLFVGSPATKYVLEYLNNVTDSIINIAISGDDADAELSGLSWSGAVPIEVTTNNSGSYSQIVNDLNVSSATNVFRVRAVRIDDLGKEWASAYRYYALGTTNFSQAPSSVGELIFSEHSDVSFKVIWTKPSNPGLDRDNTDAQLAGYRVSWGTTSEELENSFDIGDPNILSYSITELTPGTQYHVKVEAKNDNTEGSIYSAGSAGSTYTIKPPGVVVGSAITYGGHTTNSFEVDWEEVTDAGYGSEGKLFSVGYLLEISSDRGVSWQLVSRSDYLSTTETIDDLTPGTGYRVRVTATNGFSSAVSSEGGDTWTLSLPGKVGAITYSGHTTDSFEVDWEEVTDAGYGSEGKLSSVGYLLEISSDRGVSWQLVSRSDYLSTTETIDDLTPGTGYRVRVTATNGFSSAVSSEGGDTWTLSLPGKVGAITYSGHTTDSFEVDWEEVTDAGYGSEGKLSSVGYLLEISSDRGVSWQLVSRSDYLSITETIDDLTPGTGYRVRVTATNGFSSAVSSEGGDTWTLSLPGQVGGLVVSDPSYDGTLNKGGFKVSWTTPSNTGLSAIGDAATVTSYEVAYAEVVNDVVGGYTSVTHGDATTEHVFIGLNPNTEYDIRIQAKTVAGTGAETHVFGWVPSLPSAVASDSILFSLSTAHTIRIEWAAPQAGRAGGSSSTNATNSYKVEIAPDGGQYTLVQDNYFGTAITASNLSKSTTYRARVTAKNNWGERVSVSANTGTTVETDATPPSAVESLKVDSFTANQVVLSWSAPTDPGTTDGVTMANLSGYLVKYKKTTTNDFIEIDETSEGVRLTGSLTDTTATVIGLEGNTAYIFLVVASNSGNLVGLDADAPMVEQTTAVSPPGNLSQTQPCAKTTTVDLAWEPSSGATSYKIYRDGTEITSITTTSYTDIGLTPATSYTYKVQACKGDACSDDSNLLTITTLSDKVFKNIIDSARTPVDLTGYDERSREIFSRYNSDTPLMAKYLKPGGSGDGSSFADAAGNLKTVLEGITDAAANKVYVVFLTGGNYQAGSTMAMKKHVAIIGGVDECLGSSETITTLDGQDSYRVFHNERVDNTALLYGVTVTKGRAQEEKIPKGVGGGMYNWLSSPSLVKVTFSENIAEWYGGGIFNYENSSPSLDGVIFSGNTAERDGGGLYNDFKSSPTLVGVTFSGNTAKANGGGMYNWFSSPSLDGVTFSGNSATDGSGMYNFNNSSPTLVEVTFSENTATAGGGGIYNASSSPSLDGVTFSGNSASVGGGIYNASSSPSLDGGTFSGNTATADGGGIYNTSSSPSLVGVIFSGNSARLGGGIYNTNSSSPSLFGVTFSGNTATADGGGIYNTSSSPSLDGGTFSGNTATADGGGIYNTSSSPSLVGVTFSKNSASRGGGVYNSSSSPSLVEGIFSGNTATGNGGGIYNMTSSPSLVGVTFSGNSAGAGGGGGGMANWDSSPSLIGVTFSGNSAGAGGGIGNLYSSSPSLEAVTFSGNTADNGGGMYNNYLSSPSLIGVTFFGNSADNGGAIYNNNNGGAGSLIINGIFWGNTANSGTQFYFYNDNPYYDRGTYQETMRIYYSIVEGGTGTLASEESYTSVNQGGFGSGSGPEPVNITFFNIITTNPKLGELADNGGSVLTHAIPSDSSAANQGLYMKKKDGDFYYSPNTTTWYTESGLVVTPPADAEDLTTDATGYSRTDRPDIGAYEAR